MDNAGPTRDSPRRETEQHLARWSLGCQGSRLRHLKSHRRNGNSCLHSTGRHCWVNLIDFYVFSQFPKQLVYGNSLINNCKLDSNFENYCVQVLWSSVFYSPTIDNSERRLRLWCGVVGACHRPKSYWSRKSVRVQSSGMGMIFYSTQSNYWPTKHSLPHITRQSYEKNYANECPHE